MDKQLEGLRWKPRWVSHLGCVKGCLDYLGADISWAWLYGGTGHAFIINVHEAVCPSGPTAWNYEMLFRLGLNLGWKVSCVFASREDADFSEKQTKAWVHVCNSLDENTPCYGWELRIPEFYIIYGVDDDGYYYSGPGCEAGEGPKPWTEVGNTGIGILEIMGLRRHEPADDAKVVRDALSFALEHAKPRNRWTLSGYSSGPKAFDVWANALEQGEAGCFGHGYNAAVWAECRGEAVACLKEAKERLAGKAGSLFDEAIAHYSAVHSRLRELSDLHPFRAEMGDDEPQELKSPEGAALLRQAGMAERDGLEALGRLVKVL